MTGAEEAAMEWLEMRATNSLFSGRREARVIQKMLAEPRLPSEPSVAMLLAIAHTPDLPLLSITSSHREAGWPARVYRALYANLKGNQLEEIRKYGT